MKEIWILAKKELSSFFDSLTAYFLLIIFIGLSGFFTWIFGSDVFLIGQANLQPFFAVAYWTIFFFIPALTMRMIAEEKRTGTIELLQTKSITDWQIVLGKSLGCLMLIAIALLFTLPFYITISKLGNVDHGAIMCGYLGLLLMSSALIGIGIFASSISNNQIVSFLVSLLIGVFFLIISDVLSGSFSGTMASIFHYLSLSTHYDSISRGVIDSKDLIYFISIAILGMSLAQATLSKRNLTE